MPSGSAREEARRYYGKHAGVVLDVSAPEGGEHRGDLLVEVPAILEEDGAGSRPVRLRARPCLPPGFFFLPDPGDHVWVEFASGELEQPIWTGVWYPDGRAPRDADGAAPTAGTCVIRAGDHVVTLDRDEGRVVIVDSLNNRVELGADGVSLRDANGYHLRLDQLIDWLSSHRHVGNQGAPTPLFVPDQTQAQAWKPPPGAGS